MAWGRALYLVLMELLEPLPRGRDDVYGVAAPSFQTLEFWALSGPRWGRTTQKRWPVGSSMTHQRFTKATRLGDEAQKILGPFEHNVRMLLRSGDAPEAIARELARTHGVEPSAAQHFVEQLRSVGELYPGSARAARTVTSPASQGEVWAQHGRLRAAGQRHR